MKKFRVIALILCLAVCIGMMASCGKTETAMEYHGKKISGNMYSYWLSQIKSSYVSSENDNDAYWDTKYSNGQTYEDKLRQIVDYNVKVNVVCSYLFDQLGLKLTAEEKKEINTAIDDLVSAYGSKSALNKALSAYDINYDILKDIYTVELKVTKVYDALYAEGGAREITDEILERYYLDNYARIDFIMIYDEMVYVRDENGKLVFDDEANAYKKQELTDEETAKKNALADDIMKKLENGENFDELKASYNEDPQADVYKDGYFISSNDINVFGAEIVLASQEMKIGEVKKYDDGNIIYIMKRKELTDKPYASEYYLDMFEYIVDYCEQDDFSDYMNSLIDDVKVKEDITSNYSVRKAKLMNY
ncbi:MAG: hypothetical protein E7615_06535 [Ruminococcaceae bacterium]|nr:hypothetical protein [Oscillospiraceae bacterium]